MPDTSLNGFCKQIAEIVGRYDAAEIPRRIADHLPSVLARPGLLTATERALPAEGYGRNVMFVCPMDAFSVLAVVWPPGIATPIHDHATWCAFGVYEGEILESRYVPATTRGAALAEVADVHRRTAGDVAHLPVAAPNIHRMHNPGRAPAVSIHVYGGNATKLGPNVETVYTQAA